MKGTSLGRSMEPESTARLPLVGAGEREPASMFDVPEQRRREVAIEVRDLSKRFLIPMQRVDTLKERFAQPFSGRAYRALDALDGVSFDVERGEFFGVVGRNGSGKSTLLKLLASIYRADSGSIRIAGRLAPLIELGVGFNAELPARDNVVLNGVMMGLTPREARHRFDEVIAFAELEDFTELKLKNYSSGMLVRLGFSLMTQVDADVLLVDEVLAVGDASFQQKCFDAFGRMHQEGRTIVLVTHDMAAVEGHCDRALLLENGRIDTEGEPGEVARRYLQLNFERRDATLAPSEAPHGRDRPRIVDFERVWVEGPAGEPVRSLGPGEPIRLRARIVARRQIDAPLFGFDIVNQDGLLIYVTKPIETDGVDALSPGETVEVAARIENPLASGHYFVHAVAGRNPAEPEPLAHQLNATDFVVYGADAHGAVLKLHAEGEASVSSIDSRESGR
jgi:ABC-2 type transport system ATP-binding protein